MMTDTIAAVATALSDSGIGIIRVSGEQAISAVDRIFQTKGGRHALREFESHTIHYGYIADGEQILDEVMVSVFKGPKSYTAEDCVEINCHGGVLLLRKVLELVLQNGVRAAEPGEFTKRAFLNGRIDLSKAEAVMDLIQSRNDFALRSSVSQLKGSVSEEIRRLRERILYETAFIEAALDDPEHYSMEGYAVKLEAAAAELLKEIDRLLRNADRGRVLKEGINTVIVGKPNAGKSSLLNLLTGEEKAIVTDIAGTTRDAIEETVLLGGIGLNLIDTAGIRNTKDVVERIGVERAKQYAAAADLILYVADASVPLDENDASILELIQKKKTIILLNKTDLKAVVTEEMLLDRLLRAETGFRGDADRNKVKVICTSAKEGAGLEEFEKALQELFDSGELTFNEEVIITNARQKEALREAKKSLELVRQSAAAGMPEDFFTIDLMDAYASLGKIVGEEVEEDLVNEIFSKFCMGK